MANILISFFSFQVIPAIRRKMAWARPFTDTVKIQLDNARPHVRQSVRERLDQACRNTQGARGLKLILDRQPPQRYLKAVSILTLELTINIVLLLAIVLDIKENLLVGMDEHYGKAWSRIFSIGEAIGQSRRCARALISSYVTIPILQG